MLVLSIKEQPIDIYTSDGIISIYVVRPLSRVQLGIDAPNNCNIRRRELKERRPSNGTLHDHTD